MVRTLISISVLGILGCGAQGQDEGVQKVQQFLVWAPGSALVNEHTQWHTGACGQPGARLCPHSGEEFLRFHRNFTDRLRDEYERQGLAANVEPWDALPPEMKNPANGWTAANQTSENAVRSLIDPGTGARFASLEAYGTYLEGFYHNSLHGIAAAAYPTESIGPVATSPTSTYFFKIHGLVENLYRRYQAGDFNKDGQTDLVVRNTSTGGNSIWLMNGTTVSSKNSFMAVTDTNSCGIYMGAFADLNYDGNLDIVWHNPKCFGGVVAIWLMNGTSFQSTVTGLPAVGSDWTLIGTGDANNDGRPDLFWRNNASLDVAAWVMNGTTYVRSVAYDVPSGYYPILASKFSLAGETGKTSILLRYDSSFMNYGYKFLALGYEGLVGITEQLVGASSTVYAQPGAVGRFHTTTNWAGTNWPADVIFNYSPPSPFVGFIPDFLTGFSGLFDVQYSEQVAVAVSGGEIIQGPK